MLVKIFTQSGFWDRVISLHLYSITEKNSEKERKNITTEALRAQRTQSSGEKDAPDLLPFPTPWVINEANLVPLSWWGWILSARRIGILGTGAFAPATVLTNRDLEKLVDTDDQWIRDRTGISERRVCGPDEGVASMAIEAARRALESASLAPEQLSYIILGSTFIVYL